MSTSAPTSPTPIPPRTPGPAQALAWGGGAVILFLSARPVLSLFGLAGNTVLQWGFLFAPVVAAVLLTGGTLRDGLGLRPVSGRALVGAVLVMLGALPINGVAAWLQSYVLPVPVEVLEQMADALVASTPQEWALILLAAALTPAFCEEVVFRGILLHPFRGRVPAWFVLLGTSLAFGAMHWMPGTAFRILPSAVSGFAIGWMVWVSGSLWTGIVMHLVNNSLLLTAATASPGVLPEDPSLTPDVRVLIVGILFVVFGARMVYGEGGGAERSAVERSTPTEGHPRPPSSSPLNGA